MNSLGRSLGDPSHGRAIREDLRAGLSALPEWMREIVRDLLHQAETAEPAAQAMPPAVRQATRAGIDLTGRTYEEKQAAGGGAMTEGFQTVLAASDREPPRSVSRRRKPARPSILIESGT